LDKIDFLALTTNLWTSRGNEGYITITCHFLWTGAKLESAILATRQLVTFTNHTAPNFAETIASVLTEWAITNKVVCLVTDNDSIVAYFKRNTIAYEKFKDAQGVVKPCGLLQEMPTRRNSAYEKLKRIIKTNEHITVVLVTSRNAPQPLSPEEVDVLTELSKLLSPFEDAFLSVSRNTNVSVSIIIPVICKLFHKIKALDGKLKTVEGIFALDVVKSRLRERLLPYESRTVPGIATLLA